MGPAADVVGGSEETQVRCSEPAGVCRRLFDLSHAPTDGAA